MKINWGAGLVVAFLVFAAVILTMVYISMHREIDLVSDDYYQQELHHQDQIESTKRSNALSVQPNITVSVSALSFSLPRFFSAANTTGSITFYRPADRTKDFELPLKLDSANTQLIQTASLQRGLWRIKVRWRQQNQNYYHEEPILIQ